MYLGDCIDRGMHSRAVIDELLDSPLPGFEAVYLMGNHEQTLLDFLQHPKWPRAGCPGVAAKPCSVTA